MARDNGIQLVCFDLGRVLVRICKDWRHACELIGVRAPLHELDEQAKVKLDELVCASEVSAITQAAFYDGAAPLLGLSRDQIEALSDAYLLGPYPGAGELLDELAAAGVATACLSNTNPNHWRIMTGAADEHGRVVNRIDHRFASHLVRLRKPDDAIYAHVESVVGAPASSIVFFDDLKENVAAAARRGWRGHWIDPSRDEPIGQIRDYLRGHGILT